MIEMATCSDCGKDLDFFQSLIGKKKCKECEDAERQKKQLEETRMLAELHRLLEKNLRATSIDQLEEFKKDAEFYALIGSMANSMKTDEKVYVACAAKAQKSKYIRSQRTGISIPVFGLKGFMMSSGKSVPIYDMVDVGIGVMRVTDKNIHLCAASGKPMIIPYTKIEGFHLYDDGMELYQGLQKPTYFIFKETDPIQSDVIGHVIGLHTK
ncbi:MAG: hypothetical protein WC342_01155 [Methanoregula sp.]|jgi:hypothetical protein